MIKVLIIDDSALVRKLLGRVLEGEADFAVSFARDGVEGLRVLNIFKPDVVTLDIQMPQMDGLACLDRIMIERPCPVVMVSSLTREGADATLEAFRLGAVDFVPKPDGAVSLRMDEFAPRLIATLRTAAGARVKASHRLRERVQHRIGGAAPPLRRFEDRKPGRAVGNGVVLVGASTGGPPALEALLAPLPARFPWPIVVAQHMPASFTGALARRLDGLCAVRVMEVATPVVLEAGSAYIARGDCDIVLSKRERELIAKPVPSEPNYAWHPSADRLVRSALDHVSPGQLVGILMTGMGNDGAEAMTRLHALGGKTIAEAEETAVVWGMPGELAKSGGADFILPSPQIAERLSQLVPHHAADPKPP